MHLRKRCIPFLTLAAMIAMSGGILVGPIAVWAQSEDGTTAAPASIPPGSAGSIRDRLQDVRQNMLERQENAREDTQERREGVGQRLEEHRKQLIRGYFGRMVRRLHAAIERLVKLGERIQSRIDKAEANGKDASQAETALDLAKTAIEGAKGALESAKAKAEAAIGSDNPKTAFEEIRSLIETTRDKVKEAHQKLVEAIRALKGIGAGSEPDSDGTATTTP